MPSAKTAVIEYIFDQRYDPATKTVTPDIVTRDEIAAAIVATGAQLSAGNPSNFWKDLTRSSSDANFPGSVVNRGYTADDAIGASPGAQFRFVKLPAGQRTAFPKPPEPSAAKKASPFLLQSVSLPAAARLLARRDETWLAQVSQQLNVIETHFALASPREVVEVDFLQSAIKLGQSEIDVAYRLTEKSGDRWLVAVEAKGLREVIWVPQVARSAISMWASVNKPQKTGPTAVARLGVVGVIPFAIKTIGPSLVHTVEFDTGGGSQLQVVADAVIRLKPEVEGIR